MMGAEPCIGFLLLGCALMIAQMRRAIDDDDMASFISGRLSQQRPEVSFAVILLSSPPCPEATGDFRRSPYVSCIGSFQEPSECLVIILRDTIARGIPHCQGILGGGTSISREFF